MNRTTVAGQELLEDYFTTQRGQIDRALASIAALADRHPAEVRDPVAYALTTEGKRLRPILALLAWQAASSADEIPEPVYRIACSLEIVHTYSLVHDDLPCMDDDDLRRGRPTVHRVYGIRNATIAGAMLLPMAVSVLDRAADDLGLPADRRGRLVRELARAAGAQGMVGGQLLDLDAEQRQVTGEELERIHRLKTGALLTCSLRIGAIAGGSTDGLLGDLTRFGESLGLAFQIADDLLDVEGDSESLGKTAGRDIELNKASYPSLYGLDGARALAQQRIDEAHGAIAGRKLDLLDAVADFVIRRRN